MIAKRIRPGIVFYNILLLFCFTQPWSWAGDWDLNLVAAGRSLPFGGAFWGESGYGHILWGSRENESGGTGWRYGYLRPFARFQTSVVVTRADVGIDLFPISLLGMTVGVADSQRFLTKAHTGDCVTTTCGGNLARAYIRAKGVIGFGPVFASLMSRIDFMSHPDKTKPFTEEGTVIAGNAGGDHSYSNEFAGGFRFWEVWSLGLRYSSSKMLGSGAKNNQEDLFVRWKKEPFTVFAGTGFYTSTTAARSFTVFALFQWTIWPSISL